MGLTLTGREIRDLAEMAGFQMVEQPDDDEKLETEITVYECPREGVSDEDGTDRRHYRFIAIVSEYPEEGATGLGPALERSGS